MAAQAQALALFDEDFLLTDHDRLVQLLADGVRVLEIWPVPQHASEERTPV